MSKMNFLKGMGAGLLVGACIGMTVAPDKKSGKKMLSKAVKAVSTMAEDIGDILGL